MKAHELILKDITHSFSMSQLADKVGLDKRVLEKGFKITFGKTVFHFLMDERMKKAHALLRDTDIPANQVANMVGYKRPNTFSDAFKRKFGYSPRAAKNANHNVDTGAEEKESN
jgi:transcriptional regulator GlxA family with amidase domain